MISLYPLKQEKFVVPLSFGELFGFFLLVLGTLVYNEILVIPCGLMSYNTKQAIAQREDGGLLDESNYQIKNDMNYIATSPTAKYDSTRNMRNIEARRS